MMLNGEAGMGRSVSAKVFQPLYQSSKVLVGEKAASRESSSLVKTL